MLLIRRPVDIITRVYRRPDITMLYPQAAGHENVNATALMNVKIRNAVMELIKSLAQPGLKTTINGSFEIKNNQRGILSILLVGMAEFGGAHPMTVAKSLTMDTLTGESFELSQLFSPGYADIINAEIKRQIKERDIPLLDGFKGISPNQNYYVSDHTLVVYYQLYELSPYAAGFPYFPIPLYMLSGVIPENGLLTRLGYFI
ncbi:hypothetical protein Cst_c11720 [Thermoclostridium stercorarium subsp. stercorarium DSM 8532]|uniref:DUF3298 domain-containing protein n=3 Tax=Thermoclostridium stercorarium TaxID=1510 RepID=L7VRJ2_THES1|nr:DUF3298 and DUF4163 domain-containing protein [Thermoclostridium stercorarium]AGC68168.1 hypothetical protein Cst_c11720 [Thermoclostridium stercorarium subsp. stercorarium DSM 8532]AGI39195.1 hypothetical protein Clst_1127 [Thermoclostridium stercorarium subsp. stercorarium DSM 8532]ANW98540.1 hypothetical protein CSTERTH_05560 [Thermoclostridium stercorarium subsp. thermolacticum DSM 2910]ANX01075.1 hypothetical protein CSTERLE_05515 [Thermoclostridium stercorarium subsp. leptospartum DSM 